VEVRGRSGGREDRYIVRQRRIERLRKTLEWRPAFDLDRAHLPFRVDPGVSSPADGELAPAREHRVERIPNRALDRP
jgi:hypothetical protein